MTGESCFCRSVESSTDNVALYFSFLIIITAVLFRMCACIHFGPKLGNLECCKIGHICLATNEAKVISSYTSNTHESFLQFDQRRTALSLEIELISWHFPRLYLRPELYNNLHSIS